MKVSDFSHAFQDPELRSQLRLIFLCILVGVVAGLGAVAFHVMLDFSKSFFMGGLVGYKPISPGNEHSIAEQFFTHAESLPVRRWLLLILPAVGGLVSGLIVFNLAPEAEGHGTDAAIEAYHFKDGAVRKRVPFVKAVASMITIGTGGSAGREGPIAQIGSGFGSMLGQWIKLAPHERRVLMSAGMAAGIGAIFQAPFAAALFAMEVLYRDPDFEHEVFVTGFISSIVAYSVFGSIFGFHPLFTNTSAYAFNHVEVLVPCLLLAVVSAGGAILFIKVFYGVRDFTFNRVKIPNYLKPALGGLLVGVIGFFLPEALGAGYGAVQMCFTQDLTSIDAFTSQIQRLPTFDYLTDLLPNIVPPVGIAALLLALIGLAKIATTSLTVGTGGSGGVFGPAIVVGGVFGGAVGVVCQWVFPNVHPGMFALVGMAGFFAGAANSPVSTIIMVSEMTGNYRLLVPSMLVCIISYGLCRKYTLYEKQLTSRLDAPTKVGKMASSILKRLTVQQAMNIVPHGPTITVNRSTSFRELRELFAQTSQACFPVVDDEKHLAGVIDERDIRRIVTESAMEELIIARDIELPLRSVMPDDSLLAAVNRLAESNREELVVVSPEEPDQVVGTLNRGDIIAAYNRQIVTR